jgi:hypothetical protein
MVLSAACRLDTIALEIPSWVVGDLVLRKLRSDVCKMSRLSEWKVALAKLENLPHLERCQLVFALIVCCCCCAVFACLGPARPVSRRCVGIYIIRVTRNSTRYP